MAARQQAEIAQGRDLVPKQYDLSFDYWTGYHLELGSPLVSVDLVQYKDQAGTVTTMVENTDYIVDKAKRPGILAPPNNTIWPIFTPWPSSAILIRFTSGFTASDVLDKDWDAAANFTVVESQAALRNGNRRFECVSDGVTGLLGSWIDSES
jgi:hypothetical protein